jgi:hypothetical protein
MGVRTHVAGIGSVHAGCCRRSQQHTASALSSPLSSLPRRWACARSHCAPLAVLLFWSPHRFLSTGNSYKDCGHPCESSTLHVRDPQGADHLVLADMGCRNTVFNAKAQSGEAVLAVWLGRSGHIAGMSDVKLGLLAAA